MSRFAPEKRNVRSSSNGAANGKYVFKTNVWEVYVPYNKGFIIFKLLPGLNPEDGGETLDPVVLPDGSFGEWTKSVPIVQCGKGDHQVSFCAWTDYSTPDNEWDTPYYLAYTMVTRMNKLPKGDINRVESWVGLLHDGSKNEPATMPRPSEHTLAFCVPIFDQRGRRDLEQTKRQLHVLNLKKMATQALRDAVDYCMDNNVDILDFATGPLVSMWSGAAPDPWTGQPGSQDDRQYKTRLLDAVPDSPITKDISADAEAYKNLLLPWSHIINCPSMEQQARWCMNALPLDMLAQAWKDPMGNYLGFVTEDMAQRLDEGCRLAWEAEQKIRDAQHAKFSGRATFVQPTQSAPTNQAPTLTQFPSAIPGLTKPISYNPVPEKFSGMMSDQIPFDESDPDIERL